MRLQGRGRFADIGQEVRSPKTVFDLPINLYLRVTAVTTEETDVQYFADRRWRFFSSL